MVVSSVFTRGGFFFFFHLVFFFKQSPGENGVLTSRERMFPQCYVPEGGGGISFGGFVTWRGGTTVTPMYIQSLVNTMYKEFGIFGRKSSTFDESVVEKKRFSND